MATVVLHHRTARRAERRSRAYRLRPGEDLGDGIRRIARGQIDLAHDALTGGGDVGEGIHEARKAFKRQRALLRLVRDLIGDEVYRRENAIYRGLGHALSGVRDAEVIAQTLDGVSDSGFTRLRRALTAEAKAAHDRMQDDPAVVERVLTMLAAARDRVDAWPLPEGDDLAPLEPGFRRIYRRGRNALAAAQEDTDTEHLHELRKRAKDLWHAAQITRPAAPKRMRKLASRAHDLSDVVGEDHDLAVLLDAAHERKDALARGERASLVSHVGDRRAELQREGLELAGRLYARKPRRIAAVLSAAPAR